MNKYIHNYNIKPGDEIIVPKSRLDIVQHHALYLGYDEAGTDWIIENVICIGVRLITADDFFSINNRITEIRKFEGTNEQRRQLVGKALTKVGKPYNLIVYNCQHFTSQIRTGNPVSKQVEGALGILALLVLTSILLHD